MPLGTLMRTAVILFVVLLTAGSQVEGTYIVTAEVADQMLAGTTSLVTVELTVASKKAAKFTNLGSPGVFESKTVEYAGKLTDNAILDWYPENADDITVARFTVEDTVENTVCYFYPKQTLKMTDTSPSQVSEKISKADGFTIECHQTENMARLTVYAPSGSKVTVYYGGIKYWQGSAPDATLQIKTWAPNWGHGQTLAIKSESSTPGVANKIQATLKTTHSYSKMYDDSPDKHMMANHHAVSPYGTNETGDLTDYPLVTDASWVCEPELYEGWWKNEYNDYFWMPAVSTDAVGTTSMQPNDNCQAREKLAACKDERPPPKEDGTCYDENCGTLNSVWSHEPTGRGTSAENPSVAYCRGTTGLQVAEASMDITFAKRTAAAKIAGRCAGSDEAHVDKYAAEAAEAARAIILSSLSGGSQGSCAKCLRESTTNGTPPEQCKGEYYVYLKGHGFGLIDEQLPAVIFRGSISGGLELPSPKVLRLSSRLLKVQVPQAEGTSFNVAFDIIVQRGPMVRVIRQRRRGGMLTPKDTLEVKPEATVCKYCFTYLCECDNLHSA